MKWLPLLLISFPLFAGVYGKDDREESRSAAVPALLRELSLSVPAIVENKMLLPEGDHYLPGGYSMQRMNFCQEARFFGQEYLAHCSSSLIGEDLILTAGHCLGDDVKRWCQENSVVFDYAVGAGDKKISRENVYGCKEVLYYEFVGAFDEDLAIVRLDRKVKDRTPIVISSDVLAFGDALTMIGYPLGIPQKVVDDGNVTAINTGKYSFRHKLDTFSSNSGGPIFNLRGEQVGVLVRGTGPNQSNVEGKKCYDWGTDTDKDFAEGNTLLHLKLPQ